jgi:hypothetical protein
VRFQFQIQPIFMARLVAAETLVLVAAVVALTEMASEAFLA